jgi:C1A family cysteine protease
MANRTFGKKLGADTNRYMFPRLAIKEQAPAGGTDYQYLYNTPEDQGDEGTCVAFGSGGIFEAFAYKRDGGLRVTTSKAAIYSDAKYHYEPDDIKDDGLQVSDGLLVLENIGYIPNSEYPYQNNEQQILAPVPTTLVHDKSLLVTTFTSVPRTEAALRVAMYKHGPLVIGINFPEAWMSPNPDGTLSDDTRKIAGGHCMNIVTDGGLTSGAKPGYFRLRNSWGTSWGINGYAWVKFDTLLAVLTDCYTIVVP